MRSLCNGFICGMVSVLPGSGSIPPWAALAIGAISSFWYMLFALLF